MKIDRPMIFLWDGSWHEADMPVLAFSDVIKREEGGWWQVSPNGTRIPIKLKGDENGTSDQHSLK